MGLKCSWDANDYGFPPFIVEGFIIIPCDYSWCADAAAEYFKLAAPDIAPRDTGYLASSINADGWGERVETWTNCEYAQYPEFGTWCQGAQPYYRPTIYDTFCLWWEWCNEEAADAAAAADAEAEAEGAFEAEEEWEREQRAQPGGEVGGWEEAYGVSLLTNSDVPVLPRDGRIIVGGGGAQAASMVFQGAAMFGQAIGDYFMGVNSFTGTFMGIGAMALAWPIALGVFALFNSLFPPQEFDYPDVKIT